MPERNLFVRQSGEIQPRAASREHSDGSDRRIRFTPRPTKLGRNRLLQMNAKRRRLLQGIASGLNVSEAGRAAGYGTAQSAHRAMKLIRTHLPEILEKIGLPAEKVLKNFIKSVNAKKTLHFRYRGVVMETIKVPDHRIQLRTLIELAKMHGFYPMRNGRK
jgi:hypothetical protein